MLKLTHCLLFIFFLPLFIVAQGFSLTDDLGNSIQFNRNPNRVISLAPNITEMLFKLDKQDIIVGNTTFCYFPEEAKQINKVGDLLTVNYEKIIELNPDLILLTVEGNQKSVYDKLLNLGFDLFVSNPRDYEGIKKTYLDMGKIFDKQEFVENEIAKWDSTFNYIEKVAVSNTPQTVMILVELNPIMVAGKNTFINTYIETCNMKNFAEDLVLNYPIFSREVVIERNPDIIVYPSSGKENIKTLTDMYPEWSSLSAIKNNKVFFVDRDLYFRPGPRFIEALSDFFSRLMQID